MFTVFHWMWTNLAAGLVSLVVLAIGAYTVVPRLNARIAEVTATFDDRRAFRRRVTTILGLCARLQGDLTSPDDVVEANFVAERARWLGLLDQHTIWLTDNLEWYALSWSGAHAGQLPSVRALAMGYAGGARRIMLSNRPEPERIQRLHALTSHAQAVFCQRRTPRHVMRFGEAVKAMSDLLADMGALVELDSVLAQPPVSRPADPAQIASAD